MKTLSALKITLLIAILQACSTYKPSEFIAQSNTYHDYHSNYSIQILDGYKILNEAAKNYLTFSAPELPDNTTFFFNKEKNIILMFFVHDDLSVEIKNSYQKELLMSALSTSSEEEFSACDVCKDYYLTKTNKDITVEIIFNEKADNAKGILTFTPFKASNASSNYGVFTLISTSTPENYEEVKKDFLQMYNTFTSPAFNNDERRIN